MAKKDNGMVKVVCTCDRVVMVDGTILVRGQEGEIPAEEAANNEAAERVARV